MHNYVKAQRVPYYIYSLRGNPTAACEQRICQPWHTQRQQTRTHGPRPPRTHTDALTLRCVGVLPHCATLAGLSR